MYTVKGVIIIITDCKHMEDYKHAEPQSKIDITFVVILKKFNNIKLILQ